MSKILDVYTTIKKQEGKDNTLLLFKSGIFFIFVDSDAKSINSFLNLKLTNLNNDIVKCGFPCSKLDKYLNLLKQTPYTVQIIDLSNNVYYEPIQYKTNKKVINLLKKLSMTNSENLSIKEAYCLIDNLKEEAKVIIKEQIANEFNN